ncbi:Nsun2 [Symbiodinium necroappetens]|uniref:Nsun2 protein n=1 Tax=Symbiodinium necroappetens TaxID=1628268 RepID=A0A813BQL9_9DINO|nr:Nsun2 [Symbiodinium necroappetens]
MKRLRNRRRDHRTGRISGQVGGKRDEATTTARETAASETEDGGISGKEAGEHGPQQEPESAPFVCYAGDPEPKVDNEFAMGTSVPTAAAVAQGKCVVDCGTTRSIGSIRALEHLMSRNLVKTGNTGVNQVDLQDKPTFNFGNSSENQCASTVEMKLQAGQREGRLRIHALDMGQGPILLSIAALRALGAVVDFAEDVMVLRNVDCHRLIELERSASGHQLLDLSADLFEKSQPTTQAVPSLRSFVQTEVADE